MIGQSTEIAWVESQSASFNARYESAGADAAAETLDELERFRARLDGRFARTPGDVTVVFHPRALELALAQPWLPLARLATAPASRRYLAGWFSAGEIHVLSPAALERRASALPESREALRLAPLHEYAHLVVGANNPRLPPPFTPRSFIRYLRWAWLCEGAATYLSGQSRFLRPAIARRLREGSPPKLPPPVADAQLLGGTIFGLLEGTAGRDAATDLMTNLDSRGPAAALERAFGRPLAEAQGDWRRHLGRFVAG